MIARILTIPLSDWKLIGRDVFTVAALLLIIWALTGGFFAIDGSN